MKLTKSDKAAFVLAVMNDVPCPDYDKQARSLAMKWALEQMPEHVLAAYKTHPGYFENQHFSPVYRSLYIPAEASISRSDFTARFPVLHAEFVRLAELQDAAEKTQKELRKKLEVAIAACSTLKQARERLPEFVKYLPEDRDNTGVSNLPATLGLVEDLTALGWPKDKLAA